MKKKFLALVLTLAMVLSLVPVTALATGATQEGNNQGPVEVTGSDNDKNLTMKKTVTPVQNQDGTYQDGTYTVRLESYANGEVKTTTTTEPRDIVLLLDVSGSMGNPFTRDIEEYQPVYKNSLDTNKTYLIKQGWWYEEVTYCQKCKKWTRGCHDGWLTGNHKVGKIFTPTEAENDTDSEHTQFYQYVYISGKSKMDALKTAVNQFIEGIAENSPQSNISIVKFADDKTNNIGNDIYYGTNYTQIVKKLTKVDNAERVNQLKEAVSKLQAYGSTASDYGLEKAQDALKSAKQDKVVVLFTDGEPNHSSGFDYEVATKAVNTAKILKDKSTTDKSTTIYTVGVFQNPSNDVHTYMSSVSSNYPNATAKYEEGGWGKDDTWTVTDGGSTPGTYYKTADSADELINAFKTISSQVSSTHLNGNAVVVDKVPSNFKAPANAKDVTLKVADYKADGTFGTETAAPSTIHASVNKDGTVSVTGFDFSKNWCGPDGDKPHGQKLIIEFTISRTNYGGTQPTNAGAYIKASSESTEKIIDLKNPTVPVTISLGSKENSLKNPEVKDEKPYDGTGLAILPKIAEKANALATGTDNAYVNMDLTVTVDTTYTYKIRAGATTGSWYKGDSADPMTPEQIAAVTTPKDVNRDQESKEVKPYTYKFDLKLSDANPKDAESGAESKEYKDNNASFKITPRNVTLTSATDSKEYDGTPLTNNKITEGGDGFVKGEGATYTVTGYQTDVGESANEFTYTLKDGTTASNYNITTKFGKLTITKEEVPYTVIFNANGGAWSDGSDTKTTSNLNADAKIELPNNNPEKYGKKFQGWGYYPNGMDAAPEQIPALSFEALTVERLYAVVNPTETPENTVTLYAIWKDVPQSAYTYTIRQHFMKDEKQALGAQNYIELNEVQAGTAISTLIPSDTKVEFDGRMYLYEANNTTVNNQKYEGTEEITGKDTVIDLYYYLDSWKDGDIGPGDKTDDSLTGGDGIPDYKQILIQYQVYQEGNGLVTPEFEVVTVKDNKDNKELTAIHGSSVTKAGTGYTFVTWTGQNVAVTEKTVGDIIKETSAEKLKKEKCDLSKDTFEQGKSYTYTAIFLEDKLGGGDNKDQPDGIPDAWQYKVTFKVSNGKWDNETTADVVAYVTNKKDDIPCAKGTEGSKATLDGVTIPGAGSQPNSGYRASGNWDTTPSATTVINKEDTVFTYTYDQKSGGSGGSGGSHKPTVTIPDDVPTGLNGKDHYAYVVGYPDGMVYPQKNITRAEVATIFFRLLTDETREANMTKSNGYNDMKEGAWYTCAVSTLSKMGIIKGYEDGSFKPDASISRAEFAAIAARFDPDGDKTPATFSDVSSHWAKDEISIAANHGWIKGYEDGSFKPDQKITRAETMTLVNRVLKRLPETKDDLHKDMKTWPDNQNESAWFYLAVQEATNSHYQKLKKDGTHETWESMRETRDWAALEK